MKQYIQRLPKNKKELFAPILLALASIMVWVDSYGYAKVFYINSNFVFPLVFLYLGCSLGKVRKNLRAMLPVPALLLWIVVNRFIEHDVFLADSAFIFQYQCVILLFVFPYAFFSGRTESIYFGALLTFCLSSFSAVYGFLSILTNTEIPYPFFLGIAGMEWGRLTLGMSCNSSAALLMIGFFSGCLLLTRRGSSRLTAVLKAIVVVPLLIIMYTDISATQCRTVIVLTSICIGVIAAVLTERYIRLPRVSGAIICLGICAAAFLAAYLAFDAVKGFVTAAASVEVEKKPLSAANMVSVNGRTEYWGIVFRFLGTDPRRWLLGAGKNWLQRMNELASYPVPHTHNLYMELLARYGLPAVACALVITWKAVRCFYETIVKYRKTTTLSEKLTVLFMTACLATGVTEPYVLTETLIAFNLYFFFLFGFSLLIWQKTGSHGPRPD